MRTIAIVQARLGSTRLPNKVILPVSNGIPIIEVLLSRLRQSKKIDKIILATSTVPCNDTLVEYVTKLGYDVYRGSENDVLDRYYQAAILHNSDVVVRITGDCPLIDPEVVDLVINAFTLSDIDYVSNTLPPTYPDGLDVEVFSFSALKNAWENATDKADREHVTTYIRESGKYKTQNIVNVDDSSHERWTVDEQEDYNVVKSIFDYFSPRINSGWNEVMDLK